jgi:hypothetical protein
MPRKQVGFQNPKYETYRFIFNYIWEDNEELIWLLHTSLKVMHIKEYLTTM